MAQIFLYNDYIHNNMILQKRLRESCPDLRVVSVDSGDILGGALSPETVKLFVMPGGADLYWCEKLNGRGNDLIRAYVEAGGSYLGICSGAYYGAQALNWAENEGEYAICGARELSFVPATATGPLYDYIQEGDFHKSWDGIAPLSWQGEVVQVLYRGGCAFPDMVQEEQIIARYNDLDGAPAAIVRADCGKGRVILSGPHIEVCHDAYLKALYKHLNPSYDYCLALVPQLERSDAAIRRLWADILRQLL